MSRVSRYDIVSRYLWLWTSGLMAGNAGWAFASGLRSAGAGYAIFSGVLLSLFLIVQPRVESRT